MINITFSCENNYFAGIQPLNPLTPLSHLNIIVFADPAGPNGTDHFTGKLRDLNSNYKI